MSHVAEGNSTKPEGLFLCPVGFYLRAQRATRLLFFPRESSPLASFPLRRIARRVFFTSRLGSRFDSRSNPSEIARALPGPAPPLSRFSRHGEGKDYTRTFGAGCSHKSRILCIQHKMPPQSGVLTPSEHDPPFPLRDLPGSRRQVRAEARRSLTLVREQSATLRSRAGYNHSRRLPIDTNAGN